MDFLSPASYTKDIHLIVCLCSGTNVPLYHVAVRHLWICGNFTGKGVLKNGKNFGSNLFTLSKVK